MDEKNNTQLVGRLGAVRALPQGEAREELVLQLHLRLWHQPDKSINNAYN